MQHAAPPPAESGTFYGWRVVAAAFVVMTVCSGLTFYNLSVYLHAFVSSGRFAVSEVSFASSLFAVSSGMCGLWVGRLMDRHDVRAIIIGGAILCAAPILALGHIHRIWQLYAFYIVLGTGFATCALIPCTTVVARWFNTQRAAAMSIAATGNSFGAIALTPVSAALINHLGLGPAAPWLAATMLLGTVPVTWIVIRSHPRDLGLVPLGEPPEASTHAVPDSVAAYRTARRTRFFRLAMGAFLCGGAAQLGGTTHLFNLVAERAGDSSWAGLAIALMAGASVAARYPAVLALKVMSTKSFIGVLLAVQALGLAMAGLVTGPIPLMIAAAIFGSTIGNLVTMQSLLLAEAFGMVAYARLYAFGRFVLVFGVPFGPGVMGLLYQHQHGYQMPFLAVAATSLVGIVVLALAGPTPSADEG